MSLHLRELRDHIPLPHLHHDEDHQAPDDEDAPIPGYNRMSESEIVHSLHKHTQAELWAIEEYERAHLNRPAVLNKLRYLHSREPWEGYDEMPMAEILARLENADIRTLKRVRDYEHKFRNRPDIIDRAMDLHHERWAAQPRPTASYMPGGWVKG